MKISNFTLEAIIDAATKKYGQSNVLNYVIYTIRENYPFVLECPKYDMEVNSVGEAMEACLAL